MITRTWRALATITLSAGLVAGCSSSGSGGSGAGGSSSAAGGSSAAPVGSSSSSSSASSSSVASSSSAVSGDPNSTFCATARAVTADQSNNSDELASGKPAEVKKFVSKAQSELATLARLAPGSIKSDVDVLVTDIGKLYDALQANGYDLKKVTSSGVLKGLDSAKFRTASSHVEAYVKQVCKIKTS